MPRGQFESRVSVVPWRLTTCSLPTAKIEARTEDRCLLMAHRVA
jgi:hypothetical protein